MYTRKYCQLCLVVDGTFAMNTATLEVYSKLLQLPLHNKEPYACYECSALLQKYHQFHAKCLRAHNVLTQFKIQSSQMITREIFENQRKIFNLESKLSLTTVLHENIVVQRDYSSNVMSNINFEDRGVPSKYSTDLELESASADDNLTEFKLFDVTFGIKPIVTEDIQEIIELTDTPIGNLHEEPLPNIKISKNLVDTTNESSYETNAADDNNEFTDTYISYLNDAPKNDIHSKEDNNEFSDLYLGNLDEKLMSEIRNSKGLVEQATQIAQSVLLEKYMIANDKSSTNNVDLNEKLLLNIEYKELVNTATTIALQVRKKRRELNFNFFKGFAKLVPLTKETAHNEVLLRKDSRNFRNSPYKCEICYIGFLEEDSCNNHMKHHSKERPFECGYCHVRFLKKINMVRHIKNYHSFRIVCTVCDYVTYSVRQGNLHTSKHKGKKYACDECGLEFGAVSTLFAHKQKAHARELVCPLCGDEFGTPRGLGMHHRRLHQSQESPALCGPRCAECAVQFATEAAYERHLVVSDKHKGAVSNGCKFCGQTFPTAATLEAHVRRLHNRNKPRFCCTECPLRLWSARSLWRHMSERHPRATPPPPRKARIEFTVCEYCGKNVNKFYMRYHMNKHTGERPFRCEECGEGFSDPTLRCFHKRTHAPKQYQCDICNKIFNTKSALLCHIIRTHSGIHRYGCHECGKNFHFRCDLMAHVKYMHERVPRPKRKPKS